MSALVVLGVAGCSTADDGPRQAVERFLTAYGAHNTAAAAQLTDNASQARTDLDAAWKGISAE
ncbi:penicillin-binding transpeptidase domain-containing protein, partial [Streptomyces sp. SID10244]|nr:penicillin-binding transpeptidase domain-containing protein [Streptomyces sp. SID10244]